MASIKQLKKDINNDIGSIIEDIYHWELSQPDADFTKSESLIDEAIAAFDIFISKINAVEKKSAKTEFKVIQREITSTVRGLEEKLASL